MKPSILSFVLCGILLASCSLLGSGGKNSQPDIPGTIAFAAQDSTGTSQIYTIKANGDSLKQLTHEGGDEGPSGASQPSWSPDGRQIIYSSFTNSHSVVHQALKVMNADGSNHHVLFQGTSYHPLWGNNARWSPNGTKVAYDLCLNCQLRPNSDIYVFDTITQTITQLTQSLASDQFPVWSPDGTGIAFSSRRDYTDADTLRFRSDLYVVNANGSDLQRLTQSGFIGDYTWIGSDHLIYNTYNFNSDLKQIIDLNTKNGHETIIKKDLEAVILWMYWDPLSNQLFTINKKDQELPVNIHGYSLKGNLLKHVELSNSILKSALGFNFYWKTKE